MKLIFTGALVCALALVLPISSAPTFVPTTQDNGVANAITALIEALQKLREIIANMNDAVLEGMIDELIKLLKEMLKALQNGTQVCQDVFDRFMALLMKMILGYERKLSALNSDVWKQIMHQSSIVIAKMNGTNALIDCNTVKTTTIKPVPTTPLSTAMPPTGCVNTQRIIEELNILLQTSMAEIEELCGDECVQHLKDVIEAAQSGKKISIVKISWLLCHLHKFKCHKLFEMIARLIFKLIRCLCDYWSDIEPEMMEFFAGLRDCPTTTSMITTTVPTTTAKPDCQADDIIKELKAILQQSEAEIRELCGEECYGLLKEIIISAENGEKISIVKIVRLLCHLHELRCHKLFEQIARLIFKLIKCICEYWREIESEIEAFFIGLTDCLPTTTAIPYSTTSSIDCEVKDIIKELQAILLTHGKEIWKLCGGDCVDLLKQIINAGQNGEKISISKIIKLLCHLHKLPCSKLMVKIAYQIFKLLQCLCDYWEQVQSELDNFFGGFLDCRSTTTEAGMTTTMNHTTTTIPTTTRKTTITMLTTTTMKTTATTKPMTTRKHATAMEPTTTMNSTTTMEPTITAITAKPCDVRPLIAYLKNSTELIQKMCGKECVTLLERIISAAQFRNCSSSKLQPADILNLLNNMALQDVLCKEPFLTIARLVIEFIKCHCEHIYTKVQNHKLVQLLEDCEATTTAAPRLEPVKTVDTVKTLDTEEPVDTVKKAEPVDPVDTVKTAEPVEPVDAVKPDEPVEPVDTVKTAEPVEPVDTAKSAEPVQSIDTAF